VVVVAAALAGARGISKPAVAAQVVVVAGYFVLRFTVLDVGAPALYERSSGFGFGMLDPNELIARFGGNPLPFYVYNVATSLLSLLLSEPSGGVWRITQRMLSSQASGFNVVQVASSVLATGLLAWFAWRRRSEWRARRFTVDDRLVIVFATLALANAVLCYAYTKDVILSPAGAFYALALAVAAREALQRATQATWLGAAVAGVALCLISAGWAVRAAAAQLDLRQAAEVSRVEWAYVDEWLKTQEVTPTTAEGAAIVQQLQADAISRHPGRPALSGTWLKWFEQ